MKKSFKVALAGIVVGLSLICMMLSGIFPMAEYSLPALAGICLVIVVVEFGYKYGFLAYIAVAILSFLITPNKEAAFLFVAFLGYYPILKGKFEQIKNRIMEYVFKILTFNTAILFAYFVMIELFSMTELMEEINFAKYGIVLLMLLANVVFVMYDIALTRVITVYILKIKPKYFKNR